jgi:hypothetical protein
MRNRVWTGTFVAFACAAAVELAAQTGGSATSQTRAPSSSDKITVTGCIQAADQATAGTTGSTGTSTSSAMSEKSGKYILTNAKSGSSSSATGTSGTSGAASPASSASSSTASTYRLDGDDSKLSPHVGHKVEVTGSLESSSTSGSTGSSSYSSSSSSASSSSPKLKVESVRMIGPSCSE